MADLVVFRSAEGLLLGEVRVDGSKMDADPPVQSVVDVWADSAAEFVKFYDGWSNGWVKARLA